MAVPPDYEFPEVGDETAAGESYYSGNSVFTATGVDETWTTDDWCDLDPEDPSQCYVPPVDTFEERLALIEQALNL